ncbi:MAG: hypothetical protein DRH90_25310 [Deltaproteobacteria bacterium]|nr:MAG: hypothetical protein DRH90_25310 [Deltaproteobacteria bacterium]
MAKTKKQKADKRRARKKKQAKSKRQGIPKMLQRDPALREALNCHHPLVECRINKDWQEFGMAVVIIMRSAPTGCVYSGFLVDMLGLGLKDVMGDYGENEDELREHKFLEGMQGGDLVACDYDLASNLVYGGLVWARKWKFKLPKDFKVWMRLLEPRNMDEIELSQFGKDGKPLVMVSEDDFDIIMGADIDSNILRDPIATENKAIPENTLNRLGDIKSTLINFSRSPEFKEDFEMARKSRFGKKKRPKNEGEWINFQDWFVLECELMSGGTIIDRYFETYQDKMRRDVQELINGWKQVIEGLFEIKDRIENGYFVKNLINERAYKVYPTNVSEPLIELHKGDFFIGRIVPARGVHIFSGAFTPIPLDGNDRVRNEMYQMAARMQTENPARALADNPEKLKKSREAVQRQYNDFINYFGKDEVFGTGKEIRQNYQDFFDYQIFELQDPDTGLTKAEEFEKMTGKSYKPPKPKLPHKLLRNKDVAMLCDPVDSLTLLEEYGLFLKIFTDPDKHLGTSYAEDVVMGYLESDTISDVPFRRVAKRYPENFKTVIDYYAEQDGFVTGGLEDLMQAFKPESYDKLPGIVVVMDQEIANARLKR